MIDVDALHAAAPSDLRQLARLLGLEPARGARHDRVRVLCPAHAERSPSCDVARRCGRVVWTCRSCGAGGDLLALVGAVRGIDVRRDFGAVARAAADLLGVRLDADDADRRHPRRRPAPPVALALAIDDAAEQWLAGREVRPSTVIETATTAQIADARADLAELDALADDMDDALDALADNVLADIAEREQAALDALTARAA